MEPTRKADAPTWGALAEVYAQLGQDDLVQVIYAKFLSRCACSSHPTLVTLHVVVVDSRHDF